jgi:hypothetical protein
MLYKYNFSFAKSSMIELAGPGKSNQKISAAVPGFPASTPDHQYCN